MSYLSRGTSRTCFTRSMSPERLRSAPLWFYLYAWPGIFPEQWLNTRWQKPLQPPLLRSRHGQCCAAPEHWDLRKERVRDTKRKAEDTSCCCCEGRATAKYKKYNTKQSKDDWEDYSQLVLALMIVLSCRHSSPLTSCSQSRAAYPSEDNNMQWERKRNGHHTDTKNSYRQKHSPCKMKEK